MLPPCISGKSTMVNSPVHDLWMMCSMHAYVEITRGVKEEGERERDAKRTDGREAQSLVD